MTTDDIRLVIRVIGSWGILTAAVWAATVVVPGIDVPGGFWAYVVVSLLLGLVSALLGAVPADPAGASAGAGRWRPCRLVVNGLLLVVVAWLAPGLEIASFGAAMLGGLVIAAVTTALEVLWKPIKRHL